MKCRHLLSAAVLTTTMPIAAEAAVIPTNFGIGADAEVRDHQPTTNFGASTELATRIVDNFPQGHANDGNDRFSAIYMRFDLTGGETMALPPNPTAALRLTFRNTN